MTEMALGDLIRPARLVRAEGDDFPILSMTMHGGLVDQADKFKKRIASEDVSAYKVVRHGQLVVGFPIDEGVLDFQLRYEAAIVSPAYGIWDLKEAAIVDPKYLKRYLRSGRAMAYYMAKLRGSTARRRSLPAEVFLALPVFLPPLEEQRRIATILDQADALRAKRRQVLGNLDALVAARFIKMFGSPLVYQKGQVRKQIGSLAKVVTGNSPSRAIKANYGSSIEWLKSDNLGGDIATTASERLSEQGRLRAREVPPGSVLVTCIAGSPNSIGKASIVDRAVAFNQQINAVLPSADLEPAFLLHQIKVAPGLVRNKSTGGMKGLVSKSSFESIEILQPDLESQRDFARFAAAVGAQRTNVAKAGAAEDGLFVSTQSRAFRGEL